MKKKSGETKLLYADRNGNVTETATGQDKLLKCLYNSSAGRMLLKFLTSRAVSEAGGLLMDSRLSALFIGPFVKKNKIDLSIYEGQPYRSYNAFFTRQIKDGRRPIDGDSQSLISPCDAKLSVYPIDTERRFCIKDTEYTVESLLRDKKLAKRYEGGYACIFRLTVDDYHRYCYVDSGVKSENRRIPGVYHTVNPAANDALPIYKENTREYCLIKSERFGTLVQMEVGALLVGRIVNLHGAARVSRGQEKGRFEFGGSTVVVLIQKGRVEMDEDLLLNTEHNCETIVKMGERIGKKR